jgi:hypothetical protein
VRPERGRRPEPAELAAVARRARPAQVVQRAPHRGPHEERVLARQGVVGEAGLARDERPRADEVEQGLVPEADPAAARLGGQDLRRHRASISRASPSKRAAGTQSSSSSAIAAATRYAASTAAGP